MGSNNINTRCSERLVTRNLTLRLGHNPTQDLISANCLSADISRHLAFATDIPEAPRSPLLSDINIQRQALSELPIIMADEARVATIEGNVNDMVTDVADLRGDVNSLKTDVAGINDKMEKLIQAMTKLHDKQSGDSEHGQEHHDAPTSNASQGNSASQNDQTPPVSSTAPNSSNNQSYYSAQHNNQTRPSPYSSTYNPMLPRNRRQMSREEFIQMEAERDAFNYPDSGKDFVSHSVGPAKDIIKPYMYLYRDGVSTSRQKLDARQSMTASEYIDATLTLLADTRAYHPDDYQDIFHHIRKVARDTLERPWHAVRRWTQYVWDSVEAGAISWADRDIIQEERVRICLTGVHNNAIASNSSTYQIPARRQHGVQEVTCRQFNTRNGCPNRDSHQDGQVFALHICSYCDSVGRTCYHSVRECERRVTHSRNDNQQQFRNRNSGQPSYHQPQNYNSAFHNNQFPKNGFQAHQ